MISELLIGLVGGASAQPALQPPQKNWVSVYAEMSGAEVAETAGGELGIGARLRFGPLRVTPVVGTFASDARIEHDDRYREETFKNGRTVCRDLSNGQFASDELCGGEFNMDFATYGKLELAVVVRGLELAAGRRFAEAGDADFGRVGLSFPVDERDTVRGMFNFMFGDEYIALGLSFGR